MCVLLPFANCLGIPVLTTGIRRYTTHQNRGFAYGLFYVIMNVAALLSGPVVDICNRIVLHRDADDAAEEEEGDSSSPKEWSMTAYRMVLLTTVVFNALAVIVTMSVREIKLQDIPISNAEDNSDSSEHGDERSEHNPLEKDSLAKDKDSAVAAFTPLRGSAWSILKETMHTKSFWRFVFVCLITLNVRMIFRHLDATFPKYAVREFGEDFPYGTIYSINPLIIIFLVPVVTAATSHVEPLVMIHYGSYISASSVFFLAFSTSPAACIFFVIFLSIGEAVWSPRLYDYTMEVCQEGREGTYMALSSAPLFLAKLPVGFMSGYLLQKYCPSEGERNSKLMWLIIGLTTASSPILMTVFWKYISFKDKINGDSTSACESPGTTARYTELADTAPPQPLLADQQDRDPSVRAERRGID